MMQQIDVTGRWVMVVVLALGAGALAPRAQGPEPGMVRTTQAELERWMQELSNWGRWGGDDQLGAVNTITPAKRREAAALVREGTAVSLAHDLITERAADAPSPYVLDMGIFPERQVTTFIASPVVVVAAGRRRSRTCGVA